MVIIIISACTVPTLLLISVEKHELSTRNTSGGLCSRFISFQFEKAGVKAVWRKCIHRVWGLTQEVCSGHPPGSRWWREHSLGHVQTKCSNRDGVRQKREWRLDFLTCWEQTAVPVCRQTKINCWVYDLQICLAPKWLYGPVGSFLSLSQHLSPNVSLPSGWRCEPGKSCRFAWAPSSVHARRSRHDLLRFCIKTYVLEEMFYCILFAVQMCTLPSESQTGVFLL